ncbi:MAG: DRTGG domain-containing protein [Dehalococcoidia bacterium]
MAVVVVAGNEAGAGATTVAAGLAHRLAYAGHTVQIERLGDDARAASDAATFGELEFATSSGSPVATAPAAPAGGVLILEAPAGTAPSSLALPAGARLVVVGRDVSGAPSGAVGITNHSSWTTGLQIGEDHLLAAPTVGALIEASRARVLATSIDGDRAICEYIVVGPVSSDADQDHFERYARKAVVTRAEKVDIALAALRTDTRCLILSGGSDPSPYVIDRVASDRRTTLLVAPEGTVETVRDIEATFGASAFSGEEKVERAGELMAAVIDDALAERLSS